MSEICWAVVISTDPHLAFLKASTCPLPSRPRRPGGPHESLKHYMHFAFLSSAPEVSDLGEGGYEAGLYSFSKSSKYRGFQRS